MIEGLKVGRVFNGLCVYVMLEEKVYLDGGGLYVSVLLFLWEGYRWRGEEEKGEVEGGRGERARRDREFFGRRWGGVGMKVREEELTLGYMIGVV